MNDCSNAEIRDQLPDLLNERLTPGARAVVMAHVGGCVDCREELELLRDVRGALVASAPRVDIAYVVNALPKPPVRTGRRLGGASSMRTRNTWVDWRVAAAVTLLAVGGSSVAVLNRGASVSDTSSATPHMAALPGGTTAGTDTTARADSGDKPPRSASSSVGSAAQQVVASSESAASAGLGMSGRLADLNDSQLQALLDEIDQMRAVPIVDPEPVSITIDPKPSGSTSTPDGGADAIPESASTGRPEGA